jgi:hypothetical protein
MNWPPAEAVPPPNSAVPVKLGRERAKAGEVTADGRAAVPAFMPGRRLDTNSGFGEPSGRVGLRKASGNVLVPVRS